MLTTAVSVRADDERQDIKLAPCECVHATSIDFAAEFGIDSEAVRALGGRIDLAYRGPDPIGLAMAARELQAMETATQIKAGITAEHLFKHAVHVAETRYDALEMKVVASLIDDADASRSLAKAAVLSQKYADEREAKANDGELERGITNDLHVDNHSCQTVTVYYKGRMRGTVGPHCHHTFHICDWSGCPSHDHWEVEGRGCHGGYWHYVGHGRTSSFNLCFHD